MRLAFALGLVLAAGCAAPPAPPPTARTRTAREIAASVAAEADALYDELRYREAFELYEQAHALDPDDREIARRHDICVLVPSHFVHPLAADHRRAREGLATGRRAFAALDFRAAHEAFSAAVAADPDHAEAKRERARAAFLIGESPRSGPLPTDHGPAFDLHAELVTIRAILDAGRRDEARARVERVREILRWFPYDVRAFRTRADELTLESLRTP